ncbi:uncharacterized protein C9orf85 homolog [Musca domestica]|uniref:Uncharacterized protein C9orf85 homolog n=1 Tax=Musca domestica TaxID=7370 RepID=A0ABM3UN75_MUSDO|nr:uncharacterized protein C9orf85 homolog [Musca domestica]
MSTQRGNASRTRAQKHKNRTVFKNDLHDKTPLQKRLNSLHISEVCQHCKGVIEWKIKYKKYKPLTQPKTCTKCQQKKIRKAYHVLCRDCALDARVCAKCLKSAEEVEIEPPQPTPEEELKLKVEMERLIKSFPERKRRAFLRYMEKGKKDKVEDGDAENQEEKETAENGGQEENGDEGDIKPKAKPRIPHTRDELLQKIEQLKLKDNDDNEFDFDSDEEDYSSDEFSDDDDDEEDYSSDEK